MVTGVFEENQFASMGLRRVGSEPAYPAHWSTAAVQERIYPKVFFKRICPTQPLWGAAPFLSEQYNYGSRCSGFCARRQQSKLPNRVPVAVWHVLCPSRNELLDRKTDSHPPIESLVFHPKLDFSVVYLNKTMLRDRWTANIPSRVA